MDLAHKERVTGATFSHRVTGKVEIASSFGSRGGQSDTRLTFHPGARTAWHSHPVGQTVLVVDGQGRLQRDGGSIEPLKAGDVFWVEPGQRRWFGAAPDTSVALIALTGADTAADAVWMERVDERDYRAA